MPIDLELNQGSIIKLPTGLYRFCEERPHKILLLQREGTGLDLPMPEHKLVSMLGEGKAEIIDFMSAGEDEKPLPTDSADFGPGEEWAEKEDDADAKKDAEPKTFSPEVRRARALQFYTRKYDEAGRGRLGKKGLQKLIDLWRPIAIQKGYELKPDPNGEPKGFRVHPTRLKYAIEHCGRQGERPLRAFRSRRGRNKRKHFDPFVEGALDKAVNYYWSARSCDYNDAYAHFRTLMREENERRAKAGMPKLGKFPKRLETLRRRITAETNYTNWARKYSPYEAHRKFKGTKDALMATKPLEMVIMDHTKIDTWTVLDTETGLPLGRPWLTVAIDVATRMPLGYLVSFEPASLYSVLTTLKRVNKNKAYVKREFPGIKGTWNGWGRPRTIIVDHGWEFTSPSFQDALHDLGTDIIWAPVQTPQYKAIGERFFGTLNTMLFHKLPGAVPYSVDVMRVVKLDPKSEAMITLSALDETIHQAIIEVYQNEKHTGLGAIPARIWRDKIRQHRRPFIRDIKALNALLGRVTTATLTRAGITFKNMQFQEHAATGDMLDDLVKHEAKRSQSDKTGSSGRVKVKIKWNPIDASSIDVWNHGGEPRPHYVTLKNRDAEFFANLSFWHWEKIQEFAEQEDLDFRDEDERWEARDRLHKKWKSYTDKMPLRETRDARRGLAYSQGTFDDKTTNDDEDIGPEDIKYAEAESSRDGMAEATLVPDEVPAFDRQDDGRPPKGRPQTERMKKKRKRTNERNKKSEAAEKEATAERKRKREAAEEPETRKSKLDENVVFTDDSSDEDGWGDEKTSAAAGAEGEENSTTDGEAFNDLEKSDGFDDDSTE